MTKNNLKKVSCILLGLAVFVAVVSTASASVSGQSDSSVSNLMAKSGVTISFDPTNVSLNQSSNTTIIIRLDSVPQGLSGFNFNVELSNPESVRIIKAEYPTWAILNKTIKVPSDRLTMMGLDLANQIKPGYHPVILGFVVVQGLKSGSSTITLSNLQIIDDTGNAVSPLIIPGNFNVNSNGTSIDWTPPISQPTINEPIVEPLKPTNNNHSLSNTIGYDTQPDLIQNFTRLLGDPVQVQQMMDTIENTPIPNLIEDNSQPHIKLTGEFSLVNQEMDNPSNIPAGSIVYASGTGITRVFNENGKQLLIADDQEESQIEIPNGLSSATHVFEVPNGSIITSKGNATFVIYNNKRILGSVENLFQTVKNC